MDRTRKRLLPDAPHTRPDRVVALRAMLYAAEHLLVRGIGVILDAQYRRASDRAQVSELASGLRVPLFLIECAVSPEEAVRRFHRRGPDPIRLDLTPEAVHRMALEFEYSKEGLLLDTGSLTADECFARIVDYLDIV
jgi:predicted kinase